MEPAFILLPKRPRDAALSDTRMQQQPLGPCTSLVTLHPRPVSSVPIDDIWIGSGHLNGWCALWSLGKRRCTRQWMAHVQAQVSTLFYWPREQPAKHTLISHGRDGFIRFWLINFNIHSGQPHEIFASPEQCLTELRTCEFTFCHASFWPDSTTDKSTQTMVHYLAHVCSTEDTSGNAVQGTDVEVIQLPDNVIVANTSMDSTHGPTISGLTQLGMCMALQGIPRDSATGDRGQTQRSCLLLAAFESGHLFLLSRGKVLARLDNVLGLAVPIMSLGVSRRIETGQLVAVGGPSLESSTQSARTLAFVDLIWDDSAEAAQLRLHPDKLEPRPCGVSTLTWRDDGRLLAVGQWDGEVRVLSVRHSRQKWRLRCLGWLTSLGVLDSGDLLGDWAATTVKQPHGPIVDQQSTTIRACLFTTESHWLISAAPASAGAVGSLLVWDVYRTEDNIKL